MPSSHTLNALAGSDLKVIQLDVVRSGTVCTGQHQDVIVRHLLLLVSKFQELLIYCIQFLTVQFHTVHTEAVAQGSTTAAGRQHYSIVVYAHFNK